MVHEYWKVYEPNIGNLDFETLANNCDCGSKRRLDTGWFKYVVARLNDVCGGLSVEMCNLYLSLNDGFNPRLKSADTVTNSITLMTELLETNQVPDYYTNMGLDQNILIEFENIMSNNEQILS